MENNDNEARRKKLQTLFTVGITIGVLAIAAPILLTALEGLLALIAIGIIGFTTIMFAPVVAMKMANWKMKGIVDEAKRNPIETQRNVYLEKAKEVAEKGQSIVRFEAGIRNFHDKAVAFERKHPTELAAISDYKKTEETMERGLENRKKAYGVAQRRLADLDEKIKVASDKFDMAKDVAGLETLSSEAEKKFFQDLKLEVSFDEVNHQLNEAVAQLNLEVSNEESYDFPSNSRPALTEGQKSEIIPAVITETEKVTIPLKKER